MTRAGKRLSQIEALREEICRLRLQLESDTYQFEALAAWALEAASGVEGAKFCHNARFIAVASSRDAILKMAEIAVQEAQAISA